MRAVNILLLLLVTLAPEALLADEIILPSAERLVLNNGTVLILSENHDVPLIGLEAIIRGGAVTDPTDKSGLANLVAGLLQKGAGSRNAAEFAEAAASVGGELSASADLESLNISAEFMAQDAALMIELIADMLLRPTLDKQEFEKLRDRSVNLIKSAKGSDPNVLMEPYANAFLFAAHPYGNPLSGSEASLASISYRDIGTYYDEMFGGDRLIVSVSGDFDSDAMRDALVAALGDWQAAPGTLPDILPVEASNDRRVYLIDKPGATQSYFYIGNVGVAKDFPGRADLDLANTVLGGRFSSMLNTALRVESGLSYSARSTLLRYRHSGSVFIRSFTETSTTLEAIDVALGVLGQLQESGLDETVLTSARNYVMGQFPPQIETASQIAALFASLEASGLDESYINDYEGRLAAATPESVAAVIDDVYPASDSLVFVILGDAELIRDQVSQYGPLTEISISEPRFHP
jgi:zinc protease